MENNQYQPFVIGLTGLPGAGKTECSSILCEHDGIHIETDRIGHEILEMSSIREKILRHFGDEILDENKNISKPKLADLAFANPEKTKILSGISHPAIKEKVQEIISKPVEGKSFFVLEAALLVESGFNDLCDIVVLVDAPFDVRLLRLSSSRAWDKSELQRRESAQDLKMKRNHSHICINTDDIFENFRKKVLELKQSVQYNTTLAGVQPDISAIINHYENSSKTNIVNKNLFNSNGN